VFEFRHWQRQLINEDCEVSQNQKPVNQGGNLATTVIITYGKHVLLPSAVSGTP
jgi:hypothetical protein